MIAEKFYIEKFLSREEADHLFIFALGLPPKRPVIKPWGNLSRFVALGNYAEFPTAGRDGSYGWHDPKF